MSLPTSSLSPAVVLDASVSVSVSAKEPTEPKVSAEINRCLAAGDAFFAPGVIISETLYVLCGKLQNGSLSVSDHAQAVQDFYTMMATFVLPPPGGDVL